MLQSVQAMEPVPKKQKVTGQRQRLAASSVANSPVEHSALAAWLQEQWSWGYMSPQTCQKIAALAITDLNDCGLEQPPVALQKLASIGSSGCQSQNCNRDMLNLVHSISKMPAPLQEKLPLKGGVYLQNIMLPHEIFHHLWVNSMNILSTTLQWVAKKDCRNSGKTFPSTLLC